jgi:hypothetical protein
MKKINPKRHFQLLELMIAAFILLICIAPIMRIFNNMYLSQQNIIRQNYRDHIAHMAHVQITEQLYKRQIPLDDLQNRVVSLEDKDLNDLLKYHSYQFEGLLKIDDRHIPQGKEKPDKYLGKITLVLKDISRNPQANLIGKSSEDKDAKDKDAYEAVYDYYVYIDRGAKDKNTNNNGQPSNDNDDKKSDKAQQSSTDAVEKKNEMARTT